MVEYVTEEAKQNEIRLTKKQARQFLASIEKRLGEAMIATGWTIIQDAQSELHHSSAPVN